MPASRRPTRPVPPARALPRGGRHPLTQEAVAQSQRSRMLDAIGHVVAAKGFKSATVADVIALAGVSRRTFYEQFADMEGCFLAAYERGMHNLFAAIRDALQAQRHAGWRERVGLSVRAYLAALAAAPEVSWTFSIESLGAGNQALEHRGWVLEQWVAQWRALLALREREEPSTRPVSDAMLLAMVGGIEELVRDCLRRQGARGLPRLAEPITEFALAVLAGVR